MQFLDSDGRLFGRFNIIDAAIVAFVVVLVPLAYAAVLLFRSPAPEITSVEPAPVTMTEDRAIGGSGPTLPNKVKVRGTGLRPVLHATIGDRDALAYIFESPTSADVLFGSLAPGTHDLVLYDGVQEVARARGAITIAARPVEAGTFVALVGTLMDLDEATSRDLRLHAKYPNDQSPDVEIMALSDAAPASHPINGVNDVMIPGRWQRTALLRTRCQVTVLQPRECSSGGMVLQPGHLFVVPGSNGTLHMAIDLVLPDTAPEPADLRVRFVAQREVVDQMRVGDRDRPQFAVDGRGAAITGLSARHTGTGGLTVGPSQEGATVSATGPVDMVDAVLRLGLDRTSTGWRYRTDAVRAGGPFSFTTPNYVARGIVLGVKTRENVTDGEAR